MKAFSPAGMAVKAFYGIGAKTLANPLGTHFGNGRTSFGPGGGAGGQPGPPAGGPFASTWHAVTPFSGGHRIASVAWGNNEFAAIDANGNFYTSTDGITWSGVIGTIAGGPFSAATWNLIFNNGVWLAGLNCTSIARSTNGGVTWTVIATGTTLGNTGWLAAADSTHLILMVADENAAPAANFYAHSSNNGLTWTPVNPGFSSVFLSILPLWTGTEYVSMGGNISGDFVITTPDGVTWTRTPSSGPQTIATGLPFGSGWAGYGVDGSNNSRAAVDADPVSLISDAGTLAPQIDPNNTSTFAVANGNCFTLGTTVVAQSQDGIHYATGVTQLGTDTPQANTIAYSPTLKRIVVAGNSFASTGTMMYANL